MRMLLIGASSCFECGHPMPALPADAGRRGRNVVSDGTDKSFILERETCHPPSQHCFSL